MQSSQQTKENRKYRNHQIFALAGLMLAASSLPGVAMADEAATEYAITGNVGFTSDYVFNGISQSYRTPALQGGFDYIRTNGLYFGTWASSVSGNQYTNASLEWDIYGGYNGTISDDLGYTIGLMSVMYPGGKASSTKKWDTAEVIAGVTWNGLNIKYTYTLTDWYGINTDGFAPVMWSDGSTTADGTGGSKGSAYIEANYTIAIAEGSGITAHVGHQKVSNFSKLDYTDYKLAVNKSYAGFNVALSYTNTNASDNNLYHVMANGDDKKLSGSILAISAGRSF